MNIFLCTDCKRDIRLLKEGTYMLNHWPWGKDVLCVNCLEQRLGRTLTHWDFDWNVLLTFGQGSPLLEDRKGRTRSDVIQTQTCDSHPC